MQQTLFCPTKTSIAPAALAACRMLTTAPLDSLGAVYTKAPVVKYILDRVGYTSGADLVSRSIFEPGFGQGAFLMEIVERLLTDYFSERQNGIDAYTDLKDSVRAIELHLPTFISVRESLRQTLDRRGLGWCSTKLVDSWLIQGDFLLTDFTEKFDFVVGNPPYVRQDDIPKPLMVEYRRLYSTIYDRADIYVPFFEKGLGLLKAGRC